MLDVGSRQDRLSAPDAQLCSGQIRSGAPQWKFGPLGHAQQAAAAGGLIFIYKRVNKRSDIDLGNTQSVPPGGESATVLDRHGRRGWRQGGRMPGRDAHGQGRRTPGGRHVVGCKIPRKENSLISRGIGDFSIYPARARLFSGKPG